MKMAACCRAHVLVSGGIWLRARLLNEPLAGGGELVCRVFLSSTVPNNVGDCLGTIGDKGVMQDSTCR